LEIESKFKRLIVFEENIDKNKKRNFKKKPKIKIRDRYGKQRKNKIIEQDSIDKFNEGYEEFVEE